MDVLVRWSEENQIPLNIDKCKSMKFSRRKRPVQNVYNIKGETFEMVEIMKDLGVFLQSDLKYTEHVNKKSVTAKRNMGVIVGHPRPFNNITTLKILY